MKSNSRINKEEQVQVVIRLKPEDNEHKFQKCAYFSNQTSSLVVQTPNKKQYFIFDSIADQNYTQQQMYQLIGQEAVQQAIQGYNCCIFAYGQTGAGKTYSILGVLADLISNPLAETRGILPRLLQDLFKSTSKQVDKSTVRISYMEIYNQQIFDLLSPNTKVLQIRQDIKKGVFVDGINEQVVTSYNSSFDLILTGQKNRKIAATAMNSESSRSHTIFTINIDSQVQQNDIKRYRKSKINIVDLAGSQRVKHTNVQGQRLKEGCNINKSLHVLSNVINGLVESAKKKKHIPFRDSKLTYFLKDSLGGNSITKLLANIQTNRLYLGDTLSTLMFAKRAKILKTKVEINQNTNQNYDNLRQQIKKLREELAQARYINQVRVSQRNQTEIDTQYNIQKIDTSNFQSSNYDKPLQVFQQNELHYKALIEIYEQHMQQCSNTLNYSNHQQNTYINNFKKKPNILSHNEWKKIQKKNQALLNLIRRMPAFTKIFRENIMLKQDRNQIKKPVLYSQQKIKGQNQPNIQIKAEVSKAEATKAELQNVVNYYENLLKQVKTKFKECLQNLDKTYLNLQNEIIQKDKAIKQLKKRQAPPPEIQELIDQNQYLKLNILELQAQINDLYEVQQKQKIKIKEERRNSAYKQKQLIEQFQNNDCLIENQQSKYIENIGKQLQNIKSQAQKQIHQLQTERNAMINFIHDLQQILKKQIHTQKKMNIDNQSLKLINQQLHSRVQELCQTIKAQFKNDFDTTRYSDFDNLVYEDQATVKMLQKQIQINKKIREEMNQIQKKWQDQLNTSNIKKNSEIQSLKKQVQNFMKKEQQAEAQFGKSINEILEEYSEFLQSKQITTARSSKVLSGYKWRQSNLRLQRQSDFKKAPNYSTNKKQEDQKKTQRGQRQRQRLSSRESQQRKLFVYRSPKK